MSNKTNQKDSSSKTKVIVGIIIAILVLAIIGSGLFVLKKRTPKSEESVTISNSSDFIVKDVQFKDKSLNLKVGETVTLDIVVEPDSISCQGRCKRKNNRICTGQHYCYGNS